MHLRWLFSNYISIFSFSFIFLFFSAATSIVHYQPLAWSQTWWMLLYKERILDQNYFSSKITWTQQSRAITQDCVYKFSDEMCENSVNCKMLSTQQQLSRWLLNWPHSTIVKYFRKLYYLQLTLNQSKVNKLSQIHKKKFLQSLLIFHFFKKSKMKFFGGTCKACWFFIC